MMAIIGSALDGAFSAELLQRPGAQLENPFLVIIVLVGLPGHLVIGPRLLDPYPQLARDIFEIGIDGLGIVRKLFELMERLVARHLAGQDQRRELDAPRVVAEAGRKPVAFVEFRETALEML